MESLFPTEPKNLEGPRSTDQSRYVYLDESSRAPAQLIRNKIESWYQTYQDPDEDWKNRFRLSDDQHHIAASFELFLHELLIRLGYAVDVHPETGSSSSARPEFRARASSGSDFYLEAASSSDDSDSDEGARRLRESVLSQVEEINNHDFFLGVNECTQTTHQPSGNKLRRDLDTWLDQIDIESIKETSDFPILEWCDGGWSITFEAIPRSQKNRGRKDIRIIGTRWEVFQSINTREKLLRTLRKKASKYGDLELPLILAINHHGNLHEIDEKEALFGSEVTESVCVNGEWQIRHRRELDGLWYSTAGPLYTRVSAVLFINNLEPWSFGKRRARLYLNPSARERFVGALRRIDMFQANTAGKLEFFERKAPYEILGLTENWPVSGDEPW